MAKIRPASHAGSWYSSDPQVLNQQLDSWLHAATRQEGQVRAVITPHAGYDYSGPTAAWAFKQINAEIVRKVVLLGPAHHEYVQGCALPYAQVYRTPLGDIPVDMETVERLSETGAFRRLSAKAEKEEHSLEMQLPYLRKVMGSAVFTLVPIVVGELSVAQQFRYAELLSPLLQEAETVFVISSDFCVSHIQHWGENFDYTYYDPSKGEIWQSIEALDHAGMDLISNHRLRYIPM